MSVQYGLDLPGWVGCDEFLKIEGVEVRCVFESFFLQCREGCRGHVPGLGLGGMENASVPVLLRYHALIFGGSVAGEDEAAVAVHLPGECLRSQHCGCSFGHDVPVRAVEGRVDFHAAGIDHGDDDGAFRVLPDGTCPDGSTGYDGQGPDAYQRYPGPEADTLGRGDSHAQAGVGAGA